MCTASSQKREAEELLKVWKTQILPQLAAKIIWVIVSLSFYFYPPYPTTSLTMPFSYNSSEGILGESLSYFPPSLSLSLSVSVNPKFKIHMFLSKWNNLQLILKYKWLLFSEENLLQLIYKYYLIIIVNIVRNRKHFEYIAFTKIYNSRFTNNLIKY